MQGLSASKLDFTLPRLRPYEQRGKTSLLFYEDAAQLRVFTLEQGKLKWWMHLRLIYAFERVGTAQFHGFDSQQGKRRELPLPVYSAIVPLLPPPDAQDLLRVRRVLRSYRAIKKESYDGVEVWQRLIRLPLLARSSSFALHYDPYHLHADYKATSFKMWRGKIVAIDPFINSDVWDAIHLTRLRRGASPSRPA